MRRTAPSWWHSPPPTRMNQITPQRCSISVEEMTRATSGEPYSSIHYCVVLTLWWGKISIQVVAGMCMAQCIGSTGSKLSRWFEPCIPSFTLWVASYGAFLCHRIKQTGEVFVSKALDREALNSYDLQISATDGVFVSVIRVQIQILDANDNAPRCEQVSYML